MKELDNGDRSKHGYNAKDSLEQIIKECLADGYITGYEKGYRCGYKSYDNNQFFSNFLITFKDNKQWIINITTTLRDRVKMQQWDCYHIKSINKLIDKSILTYPDDLKYEELQRFKSYRLKILNHIHYSAIDDVVGQRELYELIQNYGINDLSIGKKKDFIGNKFESTIASILSNRENFEKWIHNDRVKVGVQYNTFEKIVSYLNLDKNVIIGIKATADKKIIGTLATSGKPKTDVIVFVYYDDPKRPERDVETFTFSCKKTNKKTVSVHQYNADAFADALNPDDIELRRLLKEFQVNCNLSGFGEENIKLFTQKLKPYVKRLTKWALGGYGGKNLSQLQLADYIIISDDSDIYLHTLDEYVDALLKPENVLNFGTPFRWTFASGRKGIDIQLQCKILK